MKASSTASSRWTTRPFHFDMARMGAHKASKTLKNISQYLFF